MRCGGGGGGDGGDGRFYFRAHCVGGGGGNCRRTKWVGNSRLNDVRWVYVCARVCVCYYIDLIVRGDILGSYEEGLESVSTAVVR
jgi:hypothetical protein